MGEETGRSMKFDSIAELVSMAGHGPYVWSAYGIAFVVIVANVLLPMLALRRNLADLRRRASLEVPQGAVAK